MHSDRITDMVEHTCRYISDVQQNTGAIPWFADGTLDPWDHVEAAMGLTVGGYHTQAEAAYRWLKRMQHDDGYWLAAYKGDRVVDGTRAESNFVAYVATGVWHHYLVSGNISFLTDLWSTVKSALDFVVSLQAATGEIYWAFDTRTGINKDALITGCSSIFKSFECGIQIARVLGEPHHVWIDSRERLGVALRSKPERFDRTWESKTRYSMDWFYPVLGGVINGADAASTLADRWAEFVEPQLGCRCVSDQPWVTIAETCELIMSCLAAGEDVKAAQLFDQLHRYQAEDGSWWTGYAFEDDVMWPDERPTWTAGAVILAADALLEMTPASGLFSGSDANAFEHAQRTG